MAILIVTKINYMKLTLVINYEIKPIINIMITAQEALENNRKNVHNSSKVQNKEKRLTGGWDKRKSPIKALRNFKSIRSNKNLSYN